jgi:ribosomal protein L37AE/L43A
MNCPMCDGDRIEELGRLGRLLWLLCKHCGMKFSQKAEEEENDDGEE